MKTYEKLFQEGSLSEESYNKLKTNDSGLFSLGLELKVLLYAGVLLLATGLGIAIYKNIDTIGHLVIIVMIAVISAGSFYYCLKNAVPYSTKRTNSPNILFDYILLLGGLTLISFIGYLQFQYSVFGSYTGLTFLFPAIILFAAAYYFDHLGVLSMAITSFAAFAGISVSPMQLIEGSNFEIQPLIYTGITVGALLIAAGWITAFKNIKAHFRFTYYNFGMHLLYIFTLSGLFENNGLIFLILLVAETFFFIQHAKQTHSFYIMLIAVLYAYIGTTYVFFRIIFKLRFEILSLYGGFIYLIISSILIIRFLRDYRNKLRSHDHI